LVAGKKRVPKPATGITALVGLCIGFPSINFALISRSSLPKG